MPTFMLEPIAGTENDPAWQGSTLKPGRCWVMAEREAGARQAVAGATLAMRAVAGRTPKPGYSPWQNPRLVACEAVTDWPPSLRPGIVVDDQERHHGIPGFPDML